MSILKQHNEAIKANKYNGTVTDFKAYIQFGVVHDADHNKVAFTADCVRKCIEMIQSPSYVYSRQSQYGINVYGIDSNSPVGVSLIGGIPNELEYLLAAFGRTGQLSPTEDKRTAH